MSCCFKLNSAHFLAHNWSKCLVAWLLWTNTCNWIPSLSKYLNAKCFTSTFASGFPPRLCRLSWDISPLSSQGSIHQACHFTGISKPGWGSDPHSQNVGVLRRAGLSENPFTESPLLPVAFLRRQWGKPRPAEEPGNPASPKLESKELERQVQRGVSFEGSLLCCNFCVGPLQGKAIGDYGLSLLPSITAPVQKATISSNKRNVQELFLKN